MQWVSLWKELDKLTNEILILDNFNFNGFIGKLFFIRYKDNNPTLLLRNEHSENLELCVNSPDFYREYPFGEYSLIVLRNKSMDGEIFTALFDAGIVNNPVFSIDNNGEIQPVCELTDQVVDLLKSYGEYYV